MLLFLAGAGVAPAQNDDAGFQAYLHQLGQRALAQGISARAIAQVTAGLTVNPRVIALDHAQPGASPTIGVPDFEPYRRSHVDGARIGEGRAMYSAVAGFIPQVEARYGVPASIILSIWGNESNYGRYKGDFDLPRSIATLAYEGRRRDLFANEFIALMRMVDQGVPRSRLVGSWAGAFGNPQFLPSAYLRLARDGDGDGFRDIWNSRPDTMASIANYFRDAGWRAGEWWGARALVPAGLARGGLASGLTAPTCPRVHARRSRWLTIREWRALGVQPQRGLSLTGPDDDVLAALIEPDGPARPAYLLTGNYRVILEFNCSNYYALAVGLLADEIAR